jgi:hypothetical protein
MPSRQGSGVLQRRTAIFAAVIALGPALGLANVGSANAQAFYFGFGPSVYGPRIYDPGLPPHEIMRIVRSTGLTPLTRPGRRGPYYVVVAADRTGGQMRVVVDAYAGEIVRINPMLVAGLYPPQVGGPYEPPPRVVAAPPEIKDPPVGSGPNARFDDGVPPVPPRSVPRARIATAPPATAVPPSTAAVPPHTAALPARTPTPRPRPSVASKDTPAAAPAALQATAPVAPQVTSPAPPAATPKDETAVKPAPTQMIPVAPLE